MKFFKENSYAGVKIKNKVYYFTLSHPSVRHFGYHGSYYDGVPMNTFGLWYIHFCWHEDF